MRVALVHDYLTQRGGAERVVLSLTRAFPDAPVYTSLYDPAGTYPEFAQVDVRTLALDSVPVLRRRHRYALPLLAPAFSRLKVKADVVVCSSSGWAHGANVEGRKVVYCHTPARWLYQQQRYLRGKSKAVCVVARTLHPWLLSWDKRAAATADRYVVNSSVVADRVRSIYGRDADVVPPPPGITPEGGAHGVRAIEPDFFLCVSRLLPYKNVDVVVRAFAELPDERLVVAGAGELEGELRAVAGPNVTLLGHVTDEQLRWLYGNCAALVAASHEDFGLTVIEAAAFGRPTVALRWGGYLDAVAEGENGVFFDKASPRHVAAAVRRLRSRSVDESKILAHARRFDESRFIERIRAIVRDERGGAIEFEPRSASHALVRSTH